MKGLSMMEDIKTIQSITDLEDIAINSKDLGMVYKTFCLNNNQLIVLDDLIKWYDEKDYEVDAYLQFVIFNHSNMIKEEDYSSFEYDNISKYKNIDTKFKYIFNKSFGEYMSDRFPEHWVSPELYFNTLLENSNKDIEKGFNICFIDFIESKVKKKGNATKLMNTLETFLKVLDVDSIVIQLLNPSLNTFYEKFGYIELETINEEMKDIKFMEKNLKFINSPE